MGRRHGESIGRHRPSLRNTGPGMMLLRPSPVMFPKGGGCFAGGKRRLMKHLLFSWVAIALATSALAQGIVRFSNMSADVSSPPDRLVRFGTGVPNPFGTNNAPVVNFGDYSFRAQLYYGASTADEGSLIPVTLAPSLFRSSTTTMEPGTWAPGTRILDGFSEPGNIVRLQVRVWDYSAGSTWEEALATGQGLFGKSAVFNYTIPNMDPLNPVAMFLMFEFRGFSIGTIPEPTSFALAVLGAAVLLTFRRSRK